MKREFLNVFIFLLVFNNVFAQLNIVRDDFVGTTERGWWKWYNDPTAYPDIAITDVQDGFVLFSLNDAIINGDPYYCDAAFWDGYPDPGGPYFT